LPGRTENLKIEAELDGSRRSVEWHRAGDKVRFTVDGHPIEADAMEVAPGVFSVLIGGESFEARVTESPAGLRVAVGRSEYVVSVLDPRRWRKNGGAALQAAGRLQVAAPMPGKVVRVLAQAGDTVAAGQGILVIEAMKMQNEVRSPKAGKIESLLTGEGRSVSAGEIVAIVA
jgi:biotin carboxyl carrier protein